jgi:uncharacterized SAM-binding protein YcdF (DUF218 family)
MNNHHRNSSSGESACLNVFFKLTIILIVLLVFLWSGLIFAGAYLITGDRVKPVDAIVVLSGGEGDRISEAIDKYKSGFGKSLIITRTHTEDIGEGRTYSESLQREAIENGVPADSIYFTEGESSTTAQEASAINTLVRQRNIQSILVVTTNYHTRRTKIIFGREFEGTEVKVLVHPSAESWYRPLTWYLSPQGWRQTITEYAGLFILWFESK